MPSSLFLQKCSWPPSSYSDQLLLIRKSFRQRLMVLLYWTDLPFYFPRPHFLLQRQSESFSNSGMVCLRMTNRFFVWLGVKIRWGYVIHKGVTFVFWEEGGSLVMVLAWGHRRRPVRSQVTPWGRLVGGRERGREGEGVGGIEGRRGWSWARVKAATSWVILQHTYGYGKALF